MAIPTTSFSAEVLLIVSFFLLGLWSSTFKLAGNRWRYELFSFDFAFGALLFSLAAAYTLGSFGADLGFSENLMVSSKTSQGLAIVAGGLFAFGSMLLLSGIALLGLSFACAIAASAAMLALCGTEFAGYRALLLAVAMAASVIAIVFGFSGARSAEATLPAVSLPIVVRVRKSSSSRAPKAAADAGGGRNSTKGIWVSVLAGLALGSMVHPFNTSVFGAFGLGTFAGIVLFSVGAFIGTLVLGFLLMKIAIHGGPTSIKAYLRGGGAQHILGLIGGALCAAGILLLTMINGFPAEARPDTFLLWTAGLGATLLAIALGLSKWHELSQAPGSAMRSLIIGCLFLLVAIGAFVLAMDKAAPLPTAQLKGLMGNTELFG